MPADRGARALLEYHESTKHSERSLRARSGGLDWDNQPLPFKVYRELEPIPLPREGIGDCAAPALDAIAHPPGPGGAGGGGPRVPDLAELARLLHLSAGILKVWRHGGGQAVYFRAYPNTGALYHIDLYVVAGDLPGLPAGVYHFGVHDFALRRLRAGDFRALLVEASGAEERIARAPAVAVLASTWWRNAWKYRERAWRHCFWDSGTLLANLLAVAGAQGLAPRVVLSFADAAVEQLLGLDAQREGALALVPLGASDARIPPAPALPPLALATEPLSPREIDYPAIRAAQRASALADGKRAAAWRAAGEQAAAAPVSAASSAAEELRPIAPHADTELPREALGAVIARRGSTRVFDPKRAIRFEQLSTALDRATRGLDADFLAPGASLIDLYLIAHAVGGLEPGTYYFDRARRALVPLRRGALREQAGRLGLFQELPADAAVNVYALADLRAVLERLGGRGYRAAQLEAAITGGRLYLAAYAQRLGATGLTFLDDEVTELFSPHASGKDVMFLTALGHADRARLRRAGSW